MHLLMTIWMTGAKAGNVAVVNRAVRLAIQFGDYIAYHSKLIQILSECQNNTSKFMRSYT